VALEAHGNRCSISRDFGAGLFAVTAQTLEIDDRDPAIFEPQQTLAFQLPQALVGILARDA